MRPDIAWIENPDYNAAFDDLMEQDMAAFTKTDQPSYPGYINVRFEGGTVVLTVRGDPVHVEATEDAPAHTKDAPTVRLELPQLDWDQLVAEATRERGLTGG